MKWRGRRTETSKRRLASERAAWERFENAANERAYARWMREQEDGDAARDDWERRNLLPEEDQPHE